MKPRLTTLTEDERDEWAERSAILEYEANLPRDEAEQRAMEMVLARRKPKEKK